MNEHAGRSIAEIERFNDQLNERSLQRRIEWFIKQYRPEDPEKAYGFDGELHMLVRAIYQDASAPAYAHLKMIIEALPTSRWMEPKL